MFKHLLVPVGGSLLTERAIEVGVELAQQTGAAIAGFIAEPMPPVPPGPRSTALMEQEARASHAISGIHAKEVLAQFEAAARAADVPFNGCHNHVVRIDRALIAAAESQGCDMIVMVPHGRGAFREFLFGSQTKAVLAGSALPLLLLH